MQKFSKIDLQNIRSIIQNQNDVIISLTNSTATVQSQLNNNIKRCFALSRDTAQTVREMRAAQGFVK